jgi:steroid delta-isomerase-like uncharacterized protein
VTAEDNKALVRRFVEGIQCSGPEAAAKACDEYLAPDFVNHSTMGLPDGVPGVKMFMAMLWAGLPDCQATIHDQICEGDAVVTRKTLSGTHKGDFMGVPATGRRINMDVIDILTVRDGKITSHRAMVDQAGLMQQLGAM